MEHTEKSSDDIKKNKDVAAVSYIPFMCVFTLFLRKDSKYIQFHAKQGTYLFVIAIILWLIPYVRYLNILVLAAMIIGFIEALHGKYYKMPIVSELIDNKIDISHLFRKFLELLAYIWDVVKQVFSGKHASHSHAAHEARKKKIEHSDSSHDLQKQLHEIEKNVKKEMELMEKIKEKLKDS